MAASCFKTGLKPIEIRSVEVHPADEPDPQIIVKPEQIAEALHCVFTSLTLKSGKLIGRCKGSSDDRIDD